MPYQGSQYQPPPNYGNYNNYGSHGYQLGQEQQRSQMQGSASQAPESYAQLQPQATRYQPSVDYSRTQYQTPQYYDQGHSSFYQTPQSAPYDQSVQRTNLSPQFNNSQLRQQNVQYSPDPLQQYQRAPQLSQATPTQARQQQPAIQRPTSQPSRAQPAPVSLQAPPPQWSKYQSTTSQQSAELTATRNLLPGHSNQQALPSVPGQTGVVPVPRPVPQQQLHQHRQGKASTTRPPGVPSHTGISNTPGQGHQQQHRQQPRNALNPTRQTPADQASVSIQQARHTPASRAPALAGPLSPESNRAQLPPYQPQYSAQTSQAPTAQPSGTINPSMVQRRVLTPAIPVQRTPAKVQQTDQFFEHQPSKRRRSNDGQAIPVCDLSSAPQQITSASRLKKELPVSSPLTELSSSQIPAAPTPANIDYQAMLLALSDECIDAAYSMSSSLATAEVSEEALDEYHALLSTGMGCLDSALKHCNTSDPRKEARIRLRLASLIHEETENDTEAEETLSKGIAICERARLVDLKYAMLHLLARLWYKGGRTKAALKAIEKHITEVEKLNLVHWIYAFRFLRVSLALRAEIGHAESSLLARHLTAIYDVADQQHHVGVQLVASTLEAIVHLRSRTLDGVDLAQRALAAARTHQFSQEMATMPQVRALLHYIDLACSMVCFNPDQATTKMNTMQADLDAVNSDPSWGTDASWHVSINGIRHSSNDIEADTGGIVKLIGGQPALVFSWLTKRQVYVLGFMFSGLSIMHKNASNEQQAERFLSEAVKWNKIPLDPVQQSVSVASGLHQMQRLMRINLRMYGVFAVCGRSDWEKGMKSIDNIRKDIEQLEDEPGVDIMSSLTYLEAVCKHGLADLEGALSLYKCIGTKGSKRLDAKGGTASANAGPIRTLATLNSIIILRHQGNRAEADGLLADVEPACQLKKSSYGSDYGNKAIEAAFMILRATGPPNQAAGTLILTTKQQLQIAVNAAKDAMNNQLLSIVMCIMTDTYFHNIIGEQAEKSARAGRTLAKKSQDKLWTAVADRMYGDTLEKCGKIEDATAVRHEARDLIERVPESLKRALASDDDEL